MGIEEDRRGIIPRRRKFVVNMRLPGGKKTWIAVDNLNSAKRIVEIIDYYVAGFKALPDDHPDVPGHLEEFRSAEFKQVVLQQLESETDYLQQEVGVIQSTATELPEDSVHRLDRGKTEEPLMPTDAPESSSVRFAHGVRDAVLVQDPRNPPRQMQAGVVPGHLAKIVRGMIMAKKRKHQRLQIEHVEEMTELEQLWRRCRDQEQRSATQGVSSTYESTELEEAVLASIQSEVHEPSDARGVTPPFGNEEVDALLNSFICENEEHEVEKCLRWRALGTYTHT